jgi:hypothetical protein
MKAEAALKLADGEIADRWGPLDRRLRAARRDIDVLKAEFERRGLKRAIGGKFTVFRSAKTFMRLSVEAIRAEMGEAWCRERERESTRVGYEVGEA